MNDFFDVMLNSHPLSHVPKWSDVSTPYYFEFTTEYTRVRLTKRTAYPATFAYVDGTTLVCGYGSKRLVKQILSVPLQDIPETIFMRDEFLYIRIDCRDTTITVQTDAFGTVPVFVGTTKDRCVVASDFGKVCELLAQKRPAINLLCVAQYILGHETHDRTFLQNVQLLYDRKRLEWSSGKVPHVSLPPDASMKDFHLNRTGDARLFPQQLEETLHHYWQRHVGTSGVGGSHLSCGLDSSVVTAYGVSQKYQVVAATGLFPGAFASTQQRKLKDFSDRFRGEYLAYPIVNSPTYPWIAVLKGEIRRPFYHGMGTPYRTVFEDFYMAMARRGATAMFSGVGGDELFEHVDHNHVMQNTYEGHDKYMSMPGLRPLATYLAEHSGQWQARTQLPIPLISHSALDMPAATGGTYLQYGLWLTQPLADPQLYAYMQTLPLHYFVDKILLRLYAESRGLPKSICFPGINEDFTGVAAQDHENLKNTYIFMLKNSVLAQNGLLEPDQLIEALRAGPDDSIIFVCKRLLYAEVNLRSLGWE